MGNRGLLPREEQRGWERSSKWEMEAVGADASCSPANGGKPGQGVKARNLDLLAAIPDGHSIAGLSLRPCSVISWDVIKEAGLSTVASNTLDQTESRAHWHLCLIQYPLSFPIDPTSTRVLSPSVSSRCSSGCPMRREACSLMTVK